MSFSKNIKDEILNFKFKKEEQFESFLTGLILVSSQFEEKQDEYIIRINREDISFKIKEKLVKFNLKYFRSPKNKNWIIILKKDFKLKEEIKNPAFFFAGAFLGGGSISNLNSSSYHLEISFYYKRIGEMMIEKLSNYKFEPQILKKKNKFILYIKKVEQINDFLLAIEALKSFKLFFDTKIERDHQNNANRLLNLDFFNQKKIADSANEHIKNFQKIKKNNKLNLFNKNEIIFFEEKEKQPYLSLNEMSEHLKNNFNINKTKGGLNHWLIKLKKIANDI